MAKTGKGKPGATPPKLVRLEVALTQPMIDAIDHLVEGGLHGTSRQDCVVRLIEHALRNKLGAP